MAQGIDSAISVAFKLNLKWLKITSANLELSYGYLVPSLAKISFIEA